jgi:hypothetical protein
MIANKTLINHPSDFISVYQRPLAV